MTGPAKGLAMARYNTAVFLLRAGDIGAHRENSWMSRERAVPYSKELSGATRSGSSWRLLSTRCHLPQIELPLVPKLRDAC